MAGDALHENSEAWAATRSSHPSPTSRLRGDCLLRVDLFFLERVVDGLSFVPLPASPALLGFLTLVFRARVVSSLTIVSVPYSSTTILIHNHA